MLIIAIVFYRGNDLSLYRGTTLLKLLNFIREYKILYGIYNGLAICYYSITKPKAFPPYAFTLPILITPLKLNPLSTLSSPSLTKIPSINVLLSNKDRKAI